MCDHQFVAFSMSSSDTYSYTTCTFAFPTRSFSIALIVHAICCYGYNNVVITLIITNVFNYRLYQNLLLFTKMRATLMREFIHQLLKYQNKASLIHHFQEWRLPPFPLNGNILRAYGVSGKELTGHVLFDAASIDNNI